MITFTLHAKMLKPALASLIVISSLTLSSCQDEDFGYTAEQIKYSKNFTEKYGPIPADKSWDISSWSTWKDVVNTGTRAQGDITGGTPSQGQLQLGVHYGFSDQWYEVPSGLLDWMKSQLLEGNDNRYLGSNFVLKLPSNNFAIIPVYQGGSSIMSELEVKINDYQITKVWTKSQNLQAKRTSSSDWENVRYWDGYSTYTDIEQHDEVYHGTNFNHIKDGDSRPVPYAAYHPAETINDYAVRSLPLMFTRDNIQTVTGYEYMYFSLHNIYKNPIPQGDGGHWDPNDSDPNKKWIDDKFKIDDQGKIITKCWDENDEWTTVGDRLTSINSKGYMLALNVPYDQQPNAASLRQVLHIDDAEHANAIPQCVIIGCEDANGVASDHDNNDVVFMLVGYPEAPQIVPTTEVISKRYMCEDLGATDDFDFNDVVFDVTQTRKLSINTAPSNKIDDFFNTGDVINNNSSVEITGIHEESKVQTAKIVHVCGTLPLQVRVGDYLFPKINDPTDQYATRTALLGALTQMTYTADEGPTRTRGEVGEGWNPNEEKVLANNSWNPSTNNVKVYVDWTGYGNADNLTHISKDFGLDAAEKKYFADFTDANNMRVVNFPRPGNIPYIIAVDQSVAWMKERKNIPDSWVNGNLTVPDDKKADVAGPGSITYYQDYGNDLSQALLWAGSVKGSAKITVVDLSGEAYREGIKEAKDKGYNIVNVYTKEAHTNVSTSVVGKFKLAYKQGGNWISLFDSPYNEQFLQTVGPDVNGTYVTSIMLTDDQLSNLSTNGLGIISLTNGMEICKFTMYRIWDPANSWYQKGRVLHVQSDANGTVSIFDRTSENATLSSDFKALYPYTVASYDGGSNHNQNGYTLSPAITLTAVAKPGYAFDHWGDNTSDTNKEKTITEIPKGNLSELPYYAHFITATESDLTLVNAAGFKYDSDKKEYVITLEEGSTYNVDFRSSNTSSDLVFSGFDNRVVDVEYNPSSDKVDFTIHAIGVGEQVITLQQPDGRVGNPATIYGTSPEFKIRVKVRRIPEATIPVDAAKYHKWDSKNANARILGTPNVALYNINSAAAWVSGSYTGTDLLDYADLSSADVLVAEVAADAVQKPKFLFNDIEEWGTILQVTDANTNYVTVFPRNDGSKVYVIDLAAIRNDQGFVHLKAVVEETINGSTTKITSLKVDKYNCPAETPWSEAKAAIDASTTQLTASKFYEWDKTGDPSAVINRAAGTNGVIGVDRTVLTIGNVDNAVVGPDTNGNPSTVLGSASSHPLQYADLNRTKYLVINVSNDASNTPLAVFNKKDWSTAEVIGMDNKTYSYDVLNSDGSHTYVLNLEKIRADKGYYSNFHSLISNWGGATTKINSVKVDNYSCPAESTKTDPQFVVKMNGSSDALSNPASITFNSTNYISAVDMTSLNMASAWSNRTIKVTYTGDDCVRNYGSTDNGKYLMNFVPKKNGTCSARITLEADATYAEKTFDIQFTVENYTNDTYGGILIPITNIGTSDSRIEKVVNDYDSNWYSIQTNAINFGIDNWGGTQDMKVTLHLISRGLTYIYARSNAQNKEEGAFAYEKVVYGNNAIGEWNDVARTVTFKITGSEWSTITSHGGLFIGGNIPDDIEVFVSRWE